MIELDKVERWERYDAWQHTASISSLIANICRDPKERKEPFTLADFNPIKIPGQPIKQQKPKQTWQDQKRIVEIFNAAYGGTDRRKG
ncbi:hypothetical protein SAMN02746098_01605 [Desulfosporosinus lacus DSM 15449]|uniref:Uncharacterized protein n=1 Tax=Desulfosporosinus lacus DSM 15449 TaxID=1121420 RepID=A0A1M5WH23_9FIRM|nr:hypothetical protein SAMN02746098_01605 [Desulfosporosinus lacus DSM 15449]